MSTAPIWEYNKSYPVKLLGYADALNLKHWDLVIANNVIHHLHSPYHFWDAMSSSCDRLIVSGCVSPETIRHMTKENPEQRIASGPHSRVIILPPEYHVSYLTEIGWTINEYRTDLLDTRDRNAWLINASRVKSCQAPICR
jgi:hypothetical protein